MMVGREDKKENDLFFLCSLIEYIARKTKNTPGFVASNLDKATLYKILDLADIYHSDNIDDVADSFIEKHKITNGNFDPVSTCMYSVPSHWDLGKVYKRLILSVSKATGDDLIDTLIKVFSSNTAKKIENYNCDMYYQSNETLTEIYLAG